MASFRFKSPYKDFIDVSTMSSRCIPMEEMTSDVIQGRISSTGFEVAILSVCVAPTLMGKSPYSFRKSGAQLQILVEF